MFAAASFVWLNDFWDHIISMHSVKKNSTVNHSSNPCWWLCQLQTKSRPNSQIRSAEKNYDLKQNCKLFSECPNAMSETCKIIASNRYTSIYIWDTKLVHLYLSHSHFDLALKIRCYLTIINQIAQRSTHSFILRLLKSNEDNNNANETRN